MVVPDLFCGRRADIDQGACALNKPVAYYTDLVPLPHEGCGPFDEGSRRCTVIAQYNLRTAPGDDTLAVLQVDLDQVPLSPAATAEVDH